MDILGIIVLIPTPGMRIPLSAFNYFPGENEH